MMTTMRQRCCLCGGTFLESHVIRIEEGFTVIHCPKYRGEPVTTKTKVFKGVCE
jgi:hypothetical protein